MLAFLAPAAPPSGWRPIAELTPAALFDALGLPNGTRCAAFWLKAGKTEHLVRWAAPISIRLAVELAVSGGFVPKPQYWKPEPAPLGAGLDIGFIPNPPP